MLISSTPACCLFLLHLLLFLFLVFLLFFFIIIFLPFVSCYCTSAALQEWQEAGGDRAPLAQAPSSSSSLFVFFFLRFLLSSILLLLVLPTEPVCACLAGVARGRWRSKRRWSRRARARRPSLPRTGRTASSSSKPKRYTPSLMFVLFLFFPGPSRPPCD